MLTCIWHGIFCQIFSRLICSGEIVPVKHFGKPDDGLFLLRPFLCPLDGIIQSLTGLEQAAPLWAFRLARGHLLYGLSVCCYCALYRPSF